MTWGVFLMACVSQNEPKCLVISWDKPLGLLVPALIGAPWWDGGGLGIAARHDPTLRSLLLPPSLQAHLSLYASGDAVSLKAKIQCGVKWNAHARFLWPGQRPENKTRLREEWPPRWTQTMKMKKKKGAKGTLQNTFSKSSGNLLNQ